MLDEELLVLDDKLLEFLDLFAFETPVPGHDTILASILHRSSCTLRDRTTPGRELTETGRAAIDGIEVFLRRRAETADDRPFYSSHRRRACFRSQA